METLHTAMIWPVQAPCQIAYRDPIAGYFWLRPYVDLSLKSKIWGIAIHGQVFKLTHEEDGSWYASSKIRDERSRARMPSTTVIDIASYYRRDFDAAVQVVQAAGIKAEPWRGGWYWTTEEDESGDKATVLDMANGQLELVPKKMRNGYLRLVSNHIIKKPINLGFSLAYLNGDHLEISVDFRPELTDKLWGLHVAKKFLCMKLTYEAQRMTVNKGLELGKSLSTSVLSVDLPSKANLEDIAEQREAINDTLVKLRAYGVKTDLINERSPYWLTKTRWKKDGFISYGNRFFSCKEECPCRLFAQNKETTVVL